MDLVNWNDEYHRQYGGHAEDHKNSDADIVPSQHGELLCRAAVVPERGVYKTKRNALGPKRGG